MKLKIKHKLILFAALVFIVSIIFILFVKNSNNSDFAEIGSLVNTNADGDYKVAIRFDYKNPSTFGVDGTVQWNGLLLYLENVGNNNILKVPDTADIFTDKNIFYKNLYNTTGGSGRNVSYTEYKRTYGNVDTTSNEYTILNSMSDIYNSLNTKNIPDINANSIGNDVSERNNKNLDQVTINAITQMLIFMGRYKFPSIGLYKEYTSSDYITPISPFDTSKNNVNKPNQRVYLQTNPLYLPVGTYNFGVAVINTRFNTNDYTTFPFYVSNFKVVQLTVDGLPTTDISVSDLNASIVYV
jgi:hypothetical protein